jgi:hypothetical protein
VPVSTIQSGCTEAMISCNARRSVGALSMRRPSHVVCSHGRLRHTASVYAWTRSSGTGVGERGRPSPSGTSAPFANISADKRRGRVRRAAGDVMRPT